jgi:membrane protein DedA with SNARE-associated domain
MHAILQFLLEHGYWLAGGWVLLEQLGLPVPAVPALLAMGALTATAPYSFRVAMFVVLLSALAADSCWYAVGRTKGHSVLKLLCRISIEPDSCVSSARHWFKKLGAWALVVAKFVPGLSTIATPMAGLSRMPLWKFLGADALGTLLWSGTVMGIGRAFQSQLEEVGQLAAKLGGRFALVVAVVAAAWFGGKLWQRQRFIRNLRVARIAPEEVLARITEFAIVDLRSSTEVELDRMKLPGAMWFERKELALHREKIPLDRDVVLYCT